jgi:hypothetical protein
MTAAPENISTPTGGVYVDAWSDDRDPFRYFHGDLRLLPQRESDQVIRVSAYGVQYATGRIERYITMDDLSFTLEQAGKLALALLEARDEVERLSRLIET